MNLFVFVVQYDFLLCFVADITALLLCAIIRPKCIVLLLICGLTCKLWLTWKPVIYNREIEFRISKYVGMMFWNVAFPRPGKSLCLYPVRDTKTLTKLASQALN